MAYRKIDILKAFAIVHIFETSKAVGDPATVAVLTDGAGISYGFSQFTHKSGSLKKVCTEYLRLGGTVGADVIQDRLPNLANAAFISKYSNDNELKNALRTAGKTDIMRTAQENVAVKYYMQPSVEAADGSGFTLPISLAVIYDAKNQGGYDAVRDRVTVDRSDFTSDIAFEKAWITSFCAKRKHWLATRPKEIVHKTVYRPEFFLAQIGASNWNLNFPMTVHGHKLSAKDLPMVDESTGSVGPDDPRNGPNIDPTTEDPFAETGNETPAGNSAPPAASSEPVEGSAGKEEPPAPPPVEVKAATMSRESIIATIGAFLTSIGLSIKDGLSNPYSLIVIGIFAIIGYLIYARSQKNKQERTMAYFRNAQDPNTPAISVT